MTYVQSLKARKALARSLNILAEINPFYLADRALSAAGCGDTNSGKLVHKIGKDVDHKIAVLIDSVQLTDDEKFDLHGCCQMNRAIKRIDRAIDSLMSIDEKMLTHPIPDKYVGRLLDERKDLQRVIAMINRVNSHNIGIIRVDQNPEGVSDE